MATVDALLSRTPTPQGSIDVIVHYDDSTVAFVDADGPGWWVTGVTLNNPTQWLTRVDLKGNNAEQKVLSRYASRSQVLDFSSLTDRTPMKRFHTSEINLNVTCELPKKRPSSVSAFTHEGQNSSTSVGNPTTISSLSGLPTTGNTLLILSAALGGLYPTGISDDFDVSVTWTKINEDTNNNSHCSVWYGLYSGDPGTSKTVTVSHANTGRRAISLESASGHATSGTVSESAIGNSATTSLDVGALSDFLSGNQLVAAVHARGSSSVTEDTNYTLVHEVSSGSSNEARLSVSEDLGGDLTVNWTMPGSDNGGVLAELSQALGIRSQAVIVG